MADRERHHLIYKLRPFEPLGAVRTCTSKDLHTATAQMYLDMGLCMRHERGLNFE